MKIKPKTIIWISVGIATLFVVLAIIKRLTPFKKNAVKNAKEEWARFGYNTRDVNGKWIKEGAKETDEGFWQRVGDYWKQALNRNYNGKDNVAWSSAFISWIMDKSGILFGIGFKKSSSHSTYIREYVKNRKEGKLNETFVAYRIRELPAKVGDLVCYSRENTTDLYDRRSNYKSHCDIVVNVDKRKKEIEVIGGNVNQSVAKRVLKIDANGVVADTKNKWFAIIKNNA